MNAIFLMIGRFREGHELKFIALVCLISSIRMLALYDSDTAAKENGLRNHTYVENFSPNSSISSITLFVRMTGKLQEHKTRSAVLFWPASFGNTTFFFEECDQDHIFATE